MERTKSAPQRTVANELELGSRYIIKSKAVNTMKSDRTFASLSQASSIQERGDFWISAESKEVKAREIRPVGGGQAYMGRTFEGVPSIPGDFKNNKDGTFTQLKNHKDVAWEDRVYVSIPAAAKAAKGEGPLALHVRVVDISARLFVHSFVWPSYVARVASVPRAQAGSVAEAQKGELIGVFYRMNYETGKLEPAAMSKAEAEKIAAEKGFRLPTAEEDVKLLRR